MKKTIILILGILAIITAGYWSLAKFQPELIFKDSRIDTVTVKQYTDAAKKIQQSHPDSAIILYKKGIQLLESMSKPDKTSHLLAGTYIDLAGLYLSKADYVRVKTLLSEANRLTKDKYPDIIARIKTCYGQLDVKQGEFSSANQHYASALTLAKQAKDKKLEARIISNQAIIFAMQGDFIQSKDLFSKALKIGLEINDSETISGGYLNLGVVAMSQNKFDEALMYYNKALDFYLKNNSRADMILAYQNLGNIYYFKENYSQAIYNYRKSLTIAKELDNKEGIAKNTHNIAEVYTLIGDKKQAIASYMQSIKIKEQTGDKPSIASGYRSIGMLHFEQKDFKSAYTYFQKAMVIDSTLQLTGELAKDFANLASVFAENNQQQQTLSYSLKSAECYSSIGDIRGISEINSLLGSFYSKQKNYNTAISYFQKALKQKLTLSNDQEGIAVLYNEFANTYYKQKNFQKAREYALKSYRIAQTLQLPYLLRDASGTLAATSQMNNNYKAAYDYLKISKHYNDSIIDKTKAEALVFAEARWNNEKNQQQIANLKKLNAAIEAQKLAEAKRHRTIILSLVLVFILLAFAAGSFWLYRYKQREIKQQQHLSRIAQLRLQNIRNRISPHFIFNVLNREISSVEDQAKHKEMIGLVKFLRRSLEITEQTSISLEDEIEFVRNYIQIEEANLGDDFRVHWEIDSQIQAEQWRVPAMIMQIPVENALKHALRPKKGEKQLKINIAQHDDAVTILIQDNGEGYHPEQTISTKGTGTGIKVILQTIQMLNAKNDRKIIFRISDLQNESTTGTRVEIVIPKQFDFNL